MYNVVIDERCKREIVTLARDRRPISQNPGIPAEFQGLNRVPPTSKSRSQVNLDEVGGRESRCSAATTTSYSMLPLSAVRAYERKLELGARARNECINRFVCSCSFFMRCCTYRATPPGTNVAAEQSCTQLGNRNSLNVNLCCQWALFHGHEIELKHRSVVL
jgi:hypothetical protein